MFIKKRGAVEDEFSTLASLIKAEDEDEDEEGDEDDDKDVQINLFEGEEDEDEDEDSKGGDKYDASYMKKHLQRYMKENTEYCRGAMKKLGAVAKAAEDEADMDGIGDADATLIDGTAFIKAQTEVNRAIVEAVQSLAKAMEGLSGVTVENNEIAKATGAVLLKGAGRVEIQPRKSVAGAAPMAKAVGDIRGVKEKLLKAAMNGDNDEAGNVLSQYEMAGGNLQLLPPSSQRYIESLRD